MTWQWIEQLTQLEKAEIIYAVQAFIALIALVVSIITLIFTIIIQNKQLKVQRETIEDNIRQSHFATLVSLYQLGRTLTSNVYSFDKEIKRLIPLINDHISPTDFDAIYHGADYDKLRETISYFDFIQNMIRDQSLQCEECYSIVKFPMKLYENLLPLIEFERSSKLHNFDRFDEFCRKYLSYMDKNHK